MAEHEPDGAERPHEATAHRLEKARQEGQFPQSRDLVTWLLLVCATAGLGVLGQHWAQAMVALLRWTMQTAPTGDLESAQEAWPLYLWLLQGLGLLGLLWLISAWMPLALVRFQPLLTLKWRAEKLDPISGLGRVFSLRSASELLKNLIKTALLLAVLGWWWQDWVWALAAGIGNTLQPALALSMKSLGIAVAAFLAVVTAMAALDVWMQLRLFKREMRMSTQDLRDESKETEGSPEVRQQLRQRRLEISRQRTLAAVEQSDVLITNPDHYAVALRYDAARMKAPLVIAKGADAIAQEMKAVAQRHQIPVTQAPPLARWIYRHVKVGQPVPSALFEAIAQVLAWAYEYREAGYSTRPLPDLGPMPKE